jgi:DNA primase
MRDTGHRDRHGEPLYALTQRELEELPGFHREGGSLRAHCPAHGGDSESAFSVNPTTGVGFCHRCRASFVVEDHPQQRDRAGAAITLTVRGRKVTYGSAQTRHDGSQGAQPAKRQTSPHPPAIVAPEARKRLETALARFAAALPGSPGETYLAGRGIPLDAARALGVGWAADGYFAGRVVFPLARPDGAITGATGRAIHADADPKYKAARKADGYAKTLANGGAIARAVATGAPLVVVEGPMDALAILAGGVANVVAIGSTGYPWPEHFFGVSRALVLLDNDAAGGEGARTFRDELILQGVAAQLLDAAALLGEHKDAAAYWQAARSLPAALLDALAAPTPATSRNFAPKKKIQPASASPVPPARSSASEAARPQPSQNAQGTPETALGTTNAAHARDESSASEEPAPLPFAAQLRARMAASALRPGDLTDGERDDARALADDPVCAQPARLAADIIRQWDELDDRRRAAVLCAWALLAGQPWAD